MSALNSLSLVTGVYFVTGAVGALLYDSRNGRLYHLDGHAKGVLSSIISGGYVVERSSTSLKLVSNLIGNGLIVNDEKQHWKGDVRCLAVKHRITFAWIEVTTDCNLKCIHCYEGERLRKKAEMSPSTFMRVVDELRAYGVRKIQLIGGEPLTLSLLRNFLDYALGKFEYIEVYTNGTLIDQTWVDYFCQHGIHVALSVYSYDSCSHDKVTGCVGSCVKTNKAIKMLAEAGVKYRVRNVLMKGVCLGEKNTDFYTLNPNKDVVRMVGRADVHLLTAENIRKRLITKKSFSAPVRLSQVAHRVGGHNCFSTHLYFGVDGTVYPCVMERRFSHGNIHDDELKRLLKSEILGLGKDKITECRDCEFRYFCFDCRPDALGAGVTDKPWYCTYNPLSGKWEDPESFIFAFQRKYCQQDSSHTIKGGRLSC